MQKYRSICRLFILLVFASGHLSLSPLTRCLPVVLLELPNEMGHVLPPNLFGDLRHGHSSVQQTDAGLLQPIGDDPLPYTGSAKHCNIERFADYYRRHPLPQCTRHR